jgi:hypothetical protein
LRLLTLDLPLLCLLLTLDLPLLSLLLSLYLPLLRLLSLNLLSLHLRPLLLALHRLLPLLRLLTLNLLDLALLASAAAPRISTAAPLLAAARISTAALLPRRTSRIATSAALAASVTFTLAERQTGKKDRHRQNRKYSYKEKARFHYSSSLVENHGMRSFVMPFTKAITVPFC